MKRKMNSVFAVLLVLILLTGCNVDQTINDTIDGANELINSKGDNTKTVVVSTASVYKFPQVVLEAFAIVESDHNKAVKMINERFNLEIPKVLNYPEVKREIVKLDVADNYCVEVIKCFE